jgi:hypothetical protein
MGHDLPTPALRRTRGTIMVLLCTSIMAEYIGVVQSHGTGWTTVVQLLVRAREGSFLIAIASRLAPEPIQPTFHGVQG